MPVTPFHMGPAMVVKAVAGRHFSVMSFGIAQVAIDLEPLIGILRDAPELHGWTHTFAGALGIGAAVAVISPPICRPILAWFNAELRTHRLGWLASDEPFAAHSVWIGALVGTLSHVVLDGFMHSDMKPFAPLSDANPWLVAVPVMAVYWGCFIAGLLGLAGWIARKRWLETR